jgi:hypothetical protein
MSSIDSLKLTVPVAGETTYTSETTDLRNMNSLSYSALYAHASLPFANLELLFSADGANFELYKTITLENEVKTTYNSVIPSRYFRFRLSNPSPDPMVETNIIFYAHTSATQNIDVNLGTDDITISGMATETTQLSVKGVLDDVKLNTTRVKTSDNVSDAIPVRLVAGIAGEFYNPVRANGNDLSVYIDDMNPDVAVNSGLSTSSLQTTGNASLTSIDSKIVTCDTDDVSDKLNELITQSTTQISYLTSIDSKITEVNTADVSITSSVLPTGASTSALQITGNDYLNGVELQTTETNNKLATANATLDNIKLDTANLVRVAPTDNNVQQAIPVRLMVGSSGSAFNALRSIGSDLGVYVDDMNVDAVNNSGMAKASLQTDGNNTLTTISTTLITMDGVLDNIETGINKVVTTDVLYNNATLTAGTTSSTINMGTGKDRYNTIQVIGSSVTNGFDFRFDFSIDGTNWYSDGVFSSHYHNGVTYEFAVSRLNISAPYIRIRTGATTGNNVYMSYALSKE